MCRNEQIPRQIPHKIYRLLSLVSLAGLALGIYGANKASENWTSSDPATWNPYSKTAVIIFVLVFCVTVLAFLFLLSQIHSVPTAERRIFAAVMVAVPLIAVRLIYALIGEWSGQIKWNPYFGDAGIYLGMAVIEECLVVITLVVALFSVPRLRGMQGGEDGLTKEISESPRPRQSRMKRTMR